MSTSEQAPALSHNGGPPLPVDDIASDRLNGVRAIAAYLGADERKTAYQLEKKLLPGGKLGGLWIASKRRLREHYDRITSGQEA